MAFFKRKYFNEFTIYSLKISLKYFSSVIYHFGSVFVKWFFSRSNGIFTGDFREQKDGKKEKSLYSPEYFNEFC